MDVCGTPARRWSKMDSAVFGNASHGSNTEAPFADRLIDE